MSKGSDIVPMFQSSTVPGELQTLEHWNTGTLEHWNTGTLEHWNTGTLEHWNTGTLEQFLTIFPPFINQHDGNFN
jgi:hypothetical protein